MASLLQILAQVVAGAAGWELTFVSDLNIPNGTAIEALGSNFTLVAGTAKEPGNATPLDTLSRKASGGFGGISGLAYAPSSRLMYALSDSTKPVVFVFEFRVVEDRMVLSPGTNVFLTNADGQPVPEWTVDPEGIALAAGKTLFVSSEGFVAAKKDPSILEVDLAGRVLRSLPVPEKFLCSVNRPHPRGVRPNKGFEGLSLDPEGKHLFVATEDSLLQDDPANGVGVGSVGRILEYAITGSEVLPAHEYLYEIDPMKVPTNFQANQGANGVSEILALNAQELLVLERGFAADNAANKTISQIRIYHADLRSAPDVHAMYAASEAPSSSKIRKTLLIDLANVVKQFTPPFQSLDNFEAMCFGPVLPDGSRSVILAVDNNYSERQRTAFVLLRLRKR